MNRADVKKRLDEFLACLREERALRDKLEELEFFASDEKALKKAMDEQADILRAIQVLREERVLPLVAELAEFVNKATTGGIKAA